MHARLLLASAGVLALAMAPAAAGPCADQIASLGKRMSAADAGAGPTAATSTTSGHGQAGQHPPTAVMGKATEGKATSPQDVRRQTEGQPTAADQAAGAQGTATTNVASASAALERARGLDAAGQEAQCMNAVREAQSNLTPVKEPAE